MADFINKIPDSTLSTEKALVTHDYLKRAALFYLARYTSSVENLRRILTRKVEMRLHKALNRNPELDIDAERYLPIIDEVITQCQSAGWVDDQSFSETKTASLRSRGTSTRMIRMKLAFQGVAPDIINHALAEHGNDREAAWRYAKRRRLGPYRTENRKENRLKDLAKMARAGFSGTDARAVIDGEPNEVIFS